jgi:hypothetical protein
MAQQTVLGTAQNHGHHLMLLLVPAAVAEAVADKIIRPAVLVDLA